MAENDEHAQSSDESIPEGKPHQSTTEFVEGMFKAQRLEPWPDPPEIQAQSQDSSQQSQSDSTPPSSSDSSSSLSTPDESGGNED